MATILRSDGTSEELAVVWEGGDGNGLELLQRAVGGYIEAVYLPDGRAMFVNDLGRIEGLPFNRTASFLAQQLIVGDVVVGTRRELGFDEPASPEAMDDEVATDEEDEA